MNRSNDAVQPDEHLLRSKAELVCAAMSNMPPRAPEELLHELLVHQVELQMQNETLRESLIELEKSRDRFSDFYEASPVGYITLTDQGQIADINLRGAELIGLERRKLLDQPIAHFIAADSADLWRTHFLSVLARNEPLDCELTLRSNGRVPICVRLDSLRLDGGGPSHGVRVVVTDITARKRAEEALQASDARFRNLLQSTPSVAVQGYDAEGITRYWNDASAALYGYTAADAIGRNLLDLIIPEEMRPSVRDAMRQMFTTGQPMPAGELALMRKDGSRVSVLSSHAYVHVPGNTPEMFCLDVDLTERKRAEQALRDSEARLRLAATAAHFGIYECDLEDGTLFWSSEMREILGVSADQVPTRPGVIPDFIHPEDVGLVRAMFERIFDPAGDGQIDDCHRIIRPDGCVRWVQHKGQTQFEGEGAQRRPVRLRGTLIDITSLKLGELALRASEQDLMHAQTIGAIGSWRLDVCRNVLVWSEQLHRIFEVTPGTAMTYEFFLNCVHPDDRATVDRAWQAALSGQPYDVEHRVLANGKVKWVRERGELEFTSNGTLCGGFGTCQDITDVKQAGARLFAAKAEAEAANNAKSRFLAAASHDLRQPLAAISVYVGVLKSMVSPDRAKIVANLHDCVESLSGLLTDLLDVSKLEAGVVEPTLADFDVDTLLEHLVAVHSAEAGLKGLRLRWRKSGAIACTDRQILQRIVGNLIDNAIRYTRDGGVLIGCRRHGGKRWIEVWDSGIGIPADQTTLVFEEFKQLDADAQTRGSGLGLAIAAKSAALLGLEIRLRSRRGRGSMFAIELPAGRQLPSVECLVSPPPARMLRIGLVDDNKQVLQALVLALRQAGHEPIAATTGPGLFEALGRRQLDIVISDYRLADGATGFDVIGAARRAFGDSLPAMLITGDTDPVLMRSMADRGIVVLHKPLMIETLLSSIEKATERKFS